jgi:2-polyprenyl-3-methyl-5-hydroxy-6-metoxy-1,4-benzoquinol methylase
VTKFSAIQLGTPPVAYYDGILMRANPTLHEEAFDLLRRVAPAGSRVIDVGCGQGAFSARMRDHGFAVLAVDKDPADFKAQGVDFVEVNFDVPGQLRAFQDEHRERHDVAIGMEVIEHVENPWEYCRFLLSLVRPGGLVLLTTPNAESVSSRVELLFTGLLAHFGPSDFTGSGHINPLTFHELHLIADGVGAETLEAVTLCRLPWLVVSRRPANVLKSIFGSIFRPFLGKRAQGDIICFLLRKPA